MSQAQANDNDAAFFCRHNGGTRKFETGCFDGGILESGPTAASSVLGRRAAVVRLR
jgi:hypothetical protein